MSEFEFDSGSAGNSGRQTRRDKPRSAFGTAFGLSAGCMLGIAAGFLAIFVAIALVCAGVISLGSKSAKEQSVDAASGGEPAGKPAPEKGAGLNEWVRHDEVEIRIVSAEVAPVRVEDFGDKSVSKDSHLVLRIEVRNVSKTKKADYRPPQAGFLMRSNVRDEHGNNYKSIGFGLGSRVQGAVTSSTSIYPGKMLEDVLIFEKPTDNSKSFSVTIDGEAVGGKTDYQFTVPRRAIGK